MVDDSWRFMVDLSLAVDEHWWRSDDLGLAGLDDNVTGLGVDDDRCQLVDEHVGLLVAGWSLAFDNDLFFVVTTRQIDFNVTDFLDDDVTVLVAGTMMTWRFQFDDDFLAVGADVLDEDLIAETMMAVVMVAMRFEQDLSFVVSLDIDHQITMPKMTGSIEDQFLNDWIGTSELEKKLNNCKIN